MQTVRAHIASRPEIPAPPDGATHVLAWEYWRSCSQRWELLALDTPPGGDPPHLDRPGDEHPGKLLEWTSAVLGCPVWLSSRFEVEDELAYYVTPMGGR